MKKKLSVKQDYINAIIEELDSGNSVEFYKYIYEFIVFAKEFWK